MRFTPAPQSPAARAARAATDAAASADASSADHAAGASPASPPSDVAPPSPPSDVAPPSPPSDVAPSSPPLDVAPPSTPAGGAGAASADARPGGEGATPGLSAPRPSAAPAPEAGRRDALGVFVPVLIMLVALVSWSAFQHYQLRLEATTLDTVRAAQEEPLKQAQRVRQTFETLVARTRQLADAGNPNARLVADEIAKRVNLGAVSAPASGAAR